MKRKIRICSGGIQAIYRTKALLNPFKYPLFSFQYLSHRCLRWTITPIALIVLIPLNLFLAINGGQVYIILGALQMLFYFFAIIGWLAQNKQLKYRVFYIPMYFIMMNVSALIGIKNFFLNKQSAVWEKSLRVE